MSSMRRRSPAYEPSERVGSRMTPSSRMRMDRKPNATRISGESASTRSSRAVVKTSCVSDPSHPAGKRKEIDNVMKKARQQPANEYWNKKILEVEEKDPNRWKHTGFKKMYVNGVRKSRSRSPRKAPSSPRQRPQSPPRRRGPSRTPERYKPRSPPPRYAREMPKSKETYRTGKSRPISPPPKVQ